MEFSINVKEDEFGIIDVKIDNEKADIEDLSLILLKISLNNLYDLSCSKETIRKAVDIFMDSLDS